MNEIWLSVKRVTELENTTERTFWKRFNAGYYKAYQYTESKGGGRGGKKLEIALSSLSIEARAKFFRELGSGRDGGNCFDGGEACTIDAFDRHPEYKKREALRWLAIIQAFEESVRSTDAGRCRAALDFCRLWSIEHPAERPFSDKTLFRKIRDFRSAGIAGLINGFGAARPAAEWPEEARAYLFLKYCNPNQPTASWCIDQLRHHAKQQGWRLPSDATMRRYLMSIPPETRDRYRKGEKYWREHYLPSVLRDYESMVPAETYDSDHRQFNVAVRYPSGKILFPWITAWADMRSRKVLGYEVAAIPSSDTINLSLKHTIERYGAPEHIIIDNGRDYSAKQFTGGQAKRFRFKVNEDELAGVYKLLGIEPHFAIPANAQAKPIERWFLTLEEHFDKAFPAYRGHHILARPEGVDKRITKQADRYVMDWDEFLACVDNHIELYNQDHEHQGHGMDGRSPNEVWNAHFAAHAQRRVSPSALRLLLMKSSKPVTVGRFGIVAFNGRYRSPELMELQGKGRVFYRYDPADLSILYIYSSENEFLCLAERTDRTAWNDETAYHEIRTLEKKKKQAIKAQREAAENLVQVNFGYEKREPSGRHPDKPAKTLRVLRTQLDGVQGRIDAHDQGRQEQREARGRAVHEDFVEMTRRRLEKQRLEEERKKETVRRFASRYHSTMPD